VHRHRDPTHAEICRALCPASPTKVFLGSEIGSAVAPDGTRYAALGNAFVYRHRIVPDCTCNGNSSFGLASISIESDPTLRHGDAVATSDGAIVIKGESAKRAFIPVTKAEGRLSDIRQTLASSRWAQARR
jgi:hypothetical protein